MNDAGKLIRYFPWKDEQMSPETKLIQDHLIECYRKGILTINSHSAVNGKPSSDLTFGWGGVKYDYVY